MKVLVTGGAGYIGSVVASQLVDAGHETVVLDDLSKGYREAVPEGTRLLQGNLMDAGFVRETLSEGFDGVPVKNGLIDVPDRPGLGVNLVPKEARKYLSEGDADFFD